MLPTPMAPAHRVASLFSAVTSAMQPARFPLALLAVLFISALAPLVDLAGGSKFGPRGFSTRALTESEQSMDEQRARSAARRFAEPEVVELEAAARASGSELTLAQLRSAVRAACASRIAEIDAATDGSRSEFRESEVRRIRQSAATAMRQIDAAGPRGVATVFLENERLAIKQTVNAVFKLDPEGFVTGVLTAVFTVPAAAMREEPVIFPLALVVMLAALSLFGGGICRMAAVHAGRGGRLSVLEGSGFVRARILNLVALPVLPIVLFALFALVILAFAFLLRLPVLNVLSGMLFVIPLVVALLGAILALVALAAAPLMPAAVAVEDCDAGDAITRSCALVLSRPLLWLCVLAVGIVALALGSILVTGVLTLGSTAFTAILAFAGGEAGAVIATGDEAMIATLSGPDRLVALFLSFWIGLFEAVGVAYAFSLTFDLATRGYLFMRERIDGESPSTVSGYGIG